MKCVLIDSGACVNACSSESMFNNDKREFVDTNSNFNSVLPLHGFLSQLWMYV